MFLLLYYKLLFCLCFSTFIYSIRLSIPKYLQKHGIILTISTLLPILPISHSYAIADMRDYIIQDVTFPTSSSHFSIKQSFAINKGKTPAKNGGDRTGTFLWNGGLELADEILSPTSDLKDLLNDKDVLELGAGTGIVSMALLLSNNAPNHISITDGAQEVLEVCNMNIEDNVNTKLNIENVMNKQVQFGKTKKHLNFQVGQLRWGNKQDIELWKKLSINHKGYDVIIGSEIAYEGKSVPLLLETIKQLANRENMIIFRLTRDLTNIDLREDGFDDFLKTLKTNGFDIVLLPEQQEDENSQLLVLHYN